MATNTYAMTGSGGFRGEGPGQRTAPGNSEFAGGSITRAGNPVGVGGAFSSVGAAGGPPPSFGTPATAFARNDRGSNIRIPYARVVSMHARDQLPVKDPALTGTGRKDAYEYDGLEAGELAWIMSKQFDIKPSYFVEGGDGGEGEYRTLGGDMRGFRAIASPLDISAFASNVSRMEGGLQLQAGGTPRFGLRGIDGAIIVPSAGMGGGGVNRMERMAYHNWVESHMANRVGRQVINLMATTVSADSSDPQPAGRQQGRRLTDNYNPVLDSEIEFWSRCWRNPTLQNYIDADEGDGLEVLQGSYGPAFGASLFAVPDIAYMLQKTTPGKKLQVGVPMMQGLYLMEKGPFLRSYGTDHEPVLAEVDNILSRAGRGQPLLADIDRHCGSDLAQRALLCELKKAGLLNWTPDGICLSKDHAGQDGVTEATFDARLGQLFNIGVQGPCITKTWSNESSELQVLPMDKVFILLVGELCYTVSGEDAPSDASTAAAALTKTVAAQNFQAAQVQLGVEGNRRANPLTGDTIASAAPGATTTEVAGVGAVRVTGTDPEFDDSNEEGARKVDEIAIARRLRERVLQNQIDATFAAQEAILAGAGNPTSLHKRYRNMYQQIGTAEAASGAARAARVATANASIEAVNAATNNARRAEVGGDNFKAIAKGLRNGTRSVTNAELMNFRLVKSTSSHLSNRSHFKVGDTKSRCGLKIGFGEEGVTAAQGLATTGLEAGAFGEGFDAETFAVPARTGNAEYILGGWCIGNVVDSAASRAYSHNAVRSAPNTYALNVNVNVEWWNADKLYAHYQDKERDADGAPSEGTTFMRTNPGGRTPEMVMQEKNVSYGEAIDKLRLGVNETEGFYKEPNPYGADTDPKRFGKPSRAGGFILDDDDNGLDGRVWGAAAPSRNSADDVRNTELSAATEAHFGVTG